MYTINITRFHGFNPQMDATTAKAQMKEFVNTNKLQLVNSISNELHTEPSISSWNWLYNKNEELRGLMAYNKQTKRLHICIIKYESSQTMKDEDFLNAFTEQLNIFSELGYTAEKYNKGMIIRDKMGRWLFDMSIEHYKSYRNAQGEVIKKYIN